jgi:tetratricopeptide (TPR) repeat protein
MFGDLGDRYMHAFVLNELGVVQRLTGNFAAAAASNRQALEEFSDLGEPAGQGAALNELGLVQQLTGDYAAASASHQQALSLYRDLGVRDSLPEALNSLGELASRTGASQQALDHHGQALDVAREMGAPLEEARPGRNRPLPPPRRPHPDGAARLQEALTIYQRTAAPAARRVHDTLLRHRQEQTDPPTT